jgi:hypothetical protein
MENKEIIAKFRDLASFFVAHKYENEWYCSHTIEAKINKLCDEIEKENG